MQIKGTETVVNDAASGLGDVTANRSASAGRWLAIFDLNSRRVGANLGAQANDVIK